MSARFNFQLESRSVRMELPHKLILGHEAPETSAHILLKLLAFLLFFRERLQIDPHLHDDDNPFRPDLIQLDYQLRTVLWVECGDCGVERLDRLAVKVPEAEIWVLKRSVAEAEQLIQDMARHDLRRNRYSIVGFDPAFFDELEPLLQPRNRVFWVCGRFEPPILQLEFNGIWFDTEPRLFRF